MSTPLLAAKLVELRQQKGCSQQEIADYLGVTREAYSHYERNTREPNLEIIVKLIQFYQIEVSELINESTIPIASNVPPSSLSGALPTDSLTLTVGGGVAMGSGMFMKTAMLSNNMNHFLKLFTGRHTNLDLTTITKDDISILAQYKNLDRLGQKEVRDFIRFKHTQNKKKK